MQSLSHAERTFQRRFNEAVVAGDGGRAQWLIQQVPPCQRRVWGLQMAAWRGDEAELARLLPSPEHGPEDPVDFDPTPGVSLALCWAAFQGHAPLVERLLPLSDPLVIGSSALCLAVQQNRPEAVDVLLDFLGKGGALNHAPLRDACIHAHAHLVELLIPLCSPKWKGFQALCEAASRGHVQVVKALIPFSEPKFEHSKALREAVRGGHGDTVALLIPVSDPGALSSEALQEAAMQGCSSVVEQLLPVSDVDEALAGLVAKTHWTGIERLLEGVSQERVGRALREVPLDTLSPRLRALMGAHGLDSALPCPEEGQDRVRL